MKLYLLEKFQKMILIKRNTAEFKEIKSIVSEYSDLPTRKKWILLYSLKSYGKLENRILLNTVKKDSDVLYSLAYDSLHEYIYSNNKKLFRDESLHIYYFKSNSITTSIELPFEFTGKLKKALSKPLVKSQKIEKTNIIKLPKAQIKKVVHKKPVKKIKRK